MVPSNVWEVSALEACPVLPGDTLALSGASTMESLLVHILGEGQFGARRYELDRLKSFYYSFVRPILPRWVRPLLHKVWRPNIEPHAGLGWPTEDRFVRFQLDILRWVMISIGRTELELIGLWPHENSFAFVLTHDVETQKGHNFVCELMALEERYGFRSSFNFVPKGYQVDPELLTEVRERGFEVGVHGLRHDGKLFSSQRTFRQRVQRINRYLAEWDAVGFRSPLTHRNPRWMQELTLEYDLSFFDTDPYEPMPGGTMSIWPFFIGHFVELPYTLMQDHTLLQTLGENTPYRWLEKLTFIERYHGMALVNVHPDYVRKPRDLAVYESFLQAMKERSDYWHALPCDVVRWWRARAAAQVDYEDERWFIHDLPGATIWCAKLSEQGVEITVPRGAK